MSQRTFIGLTAAAVLAFAITAAGQTIPKVALPILTTSAGQSTDVTTLNIILDEAGVPYDYCDAATAEMVADGVGLGGRESGPGFHVESTNDPAKIPAGTAYKAVLFAIGASLKGMGASGLTLDSEEARLKKILEYCKQKKIFIMAVHIGGESKRGPAGSDNERMIDAVAHYADYIVVTKDSNKDGRFTKIAQAKKMPISEIDYALGLVDIVKQMFQ
ncbi:MAG TPA: DUF6305 family protein [Candidatus Aminicenantes bacterium]|nr:DUF6305 family protein [Candidatus Aminicenantes bacterium]HRY65280.1 DUF6305 family protein [Candidatus Aminicenantes bacterium]HRZ72252.1 DUF6305 family protein [Candidatus Aminicenantes bacterium]